MYMDFTDILPKVNTGFIEDQLIRWENDVWNITSFVYKP